jgi:ferredoxin-type protein NapG
MSRLLEEPTGRGAFFRSLGQLLGGLVADRVSDAVTGLGPKLLRPPGALDEFDFLTACTRCDKCLETCPQNSIQKAGPRTGLALNSPTIEPRSMPCFLCTELPCIPVCPEGALVWPRLQRPEPGGGVTELEGPRAVRMGTAEVSRALCLTYDTLDRAAMACHTCVDRCPYPGEALRMEESDHDAMFHPLVDAEHCTGCGLCVFACPTLEPAIVVVPRG